MLGDVKAYVADLKAIKPMFDEGKVPKINWKEVRPYIALEYFNAEAMMKKNPAAAGLCNFIINIVGYYDIVSMVEPKKQALAEAMVTLEGANTKLAGVIALVKELDDKLAVLIADLDAANATKKEAEDTVARGLLKLSLAERLINALAGSVLSKRCELHQRMGVT